MPSQAVASSPPNQRPDRDQGPRLNKLQVEKAVHALIRHHEKVLSEKGQGKRKDLLGDSWEYIHIQLTMVKVPQHHGGPKPLPIRLPHPIYSPDDGFSMCLIVKEDCKATVKKALQELRIDGVTEVVGLQELRTDYKQYQERRTLRDAFDMFLVDDRIMALLGRVLGKIFFRKKKQPVPIKLGAMLKGDANTVGKRILDARNRTYMYRSPGVCTSVRAARTDFPVAKAANNVYEAIQSMVELTPGKWKNVQSVCIKTPESVALPVYNAMPSYLRQAPKADTPAEDKETNKEEGGKKSAADSTEGEAGKKKATEKGKKRERPAAEESKPTKKAKGAEDTPAAGKKKRAAGVDEPAAKTAAPVVTKKAKASLTETLPSKKPKAPKAAKQGGQQAAAGTKASKASPVKKAGAAPVVAGGGIKQKVQVAVVGKKNK